MWGLQSEDVIDQEIMMVLMVEINLSDRAAIVTGSSRGIGREIAVQFAEAGADLVLAARTISDLEETKNAVEEAGSRAVVVRTDLRKEDDINNLVDTAFDSFGNLDILVNNAGINHNYHPFEITTDQLDEMIDVNFRAVFLLGRKFGERLLDRSVASGRIINISAGSADIGNPNFTAYGGTNAGINALTRGFAASFAYQGLTVNSVTPGLTRTSRVEEVLRERDIHNIDEIPIGRLAEPKDIANTCLFLASDLAEYITGEVIRVDGGIHFSSSVFENT